MILILIIVVGDCLVRALSISIWYFAIPIAFGQILHLSVINYDLKNLLTLHKTQHSSVYTSSSLGRITSVNSKDVDQPSSSSVGM